MWVALGVALALFFLVRSWYGVHSRRAVRTLFGPGVVSVLAGDTQRAICAGILAIGQDAIGLELPSRAHDAFRRRLRRCVANEFTPPTCGYIAHR